MRRERFFHSDRWQLRSIENNKVSRFWHCWLASEFSARLIVRSILPIEYQTIECIHPHGRLKNASVALVSINDFMVNDSKDLQINASLRHMRRPSNHEISIFATVHWNATARRRRLHLSLIASSRPEKTFEQIESARFIIALTFSDPIREPYANERTGEWSMAQPIILRFYVSTSAST